MDRLVTTTARTTVLICTLGLALLGTSVPASAAGSGTGTPNEPPEAVFEYECSGLTCRFDASQSTDDVAISSYACDFDDEASSTGVILLHTFPAAGSYDVTLTVTDNNSGFTSTTHIVTVTIIGPPTADTVTYVGSRSAHAATRTVRTRVPSAVEAGDRLVLILTVNDGAPGVGGPAPDRGWKRIGSIRAKTMKTIVWTTTASATSAGEAVRVGFDDAAKSSLTISAYDGAGSAAPTIRLGTDLATTKARSTPTVNAETGAWVLSYWADQSSQTTEWTTSRATGRQSECGGGTRHICSLLADSSASVPAGQYDGVTARTDHPSSLATLLSIELVPAS